MSENELFKIPEEALKKIKTQAEFEAYMQELYKQGVEDLLKAEINEHLGYPKHDPSFYTIMEMEGESILI
ncbi:MAG: hypothetical protein Q8868_13550 [Bacteroidota bacterium]|nr:hypothetical protein [Bacteroidota bacterium]